MATEPSFEVRIVGLQRDKRAVLDFLQTSGVLHITEAEDSERDEPLGVASELAGALLTVKWMREHLAIEDDDHAFSGASLEETLEAYAALRAALRDELLANVEASERSTDAIERLEARHALLAAIPFELPRGVKLPHRGPHGFAMIVEHDHERLDRFFNGVRVSLEEGGGYALLTGPRADYDAVNAIVLERNLRVFSLEPLERTRERELEALDERIRGEREALARLEAERVRMRAEHGAAISGIGRDLAVLHERYEKPLAFGRTASTFVVSGFVPESRLEALRRIGDVARVNVEVERAEQAPVKLRNPPYVRSYEFLTGMFGLPRYGTIDPTPFLAVFVPLFFGFMFSDVGYGLLLLGAAIWLRTRATPTRPVVRNASIVLGVSALSTIAFGLAFGSFFGGLVPITPLLFDPFSNAELILGIALALGLVHLNIGLVVSIVEHAKRRRVREIVLGAVPYLALQAGVALLVFHDTIAGGAFVAVAIGLLIVRSSLMGLMELTGFVGTWFSYARLLALSLATAGIALGVNIMGAQIEHIHIVGPVLFVVFLVIGHLFNFALNVLGSSIHSVRLHYIEFFSQFYDGGGEAYRPFETDEKQETL